MNTWGKFDSTTDETHPLAHHCADVAAVFEALVKHTLLGSKLETAAGCGLSPTDFARLSILCFLHDAGKLHPDFQAKAWKHSGRTAMRCSHSYAGCEIFFKPGPPGIAESLGLRVLIGWGESGQLLSAALAHHGRPLSLQPAHVFATDRWRAVEFPQGRYDPQEAAKQLGACMRRWFPDAFVHTGGRLPTNPVFAHLFCGMVALSDWIGSDRNVFAYSGALDDDYIEIARERAGRMIARLRLDAGDLRQQGLGNKSFTSVTGFAAPNAHQELVGSVPDTEQLVILEADTGTGKTEAAIWRFVQLAVAGRVDSLYFALPTRAAAMQIHGRIQKMLDRTWGEDAPDAVLAVPGYLKSGTSEGIALPDWKVLWSDADTLSEDELAARWAAESARRFLAAMVAVGTVDQAMLGALQVKHAHLRAAALARSLLVVDEVHASDTYMGRIQEELLKAHLARGGYAMLMSATLASCARERWLRQPASDFQSSVRTPYPAVWTQATRNPMVCGTIGRDKQVHMRTLPSITAEGVACQAITAALAGARVLVVRNTVRAAIECWDAIQANGGEQLLLSVARQPALHHGRFAPEDRRLLDRAVEDLLGRGAARRGGRIVVGTQTLEQSLDIDADLLFTDLCPVDVLLQRIGRLHRHGETARAPQFRNPKCFVLLPEHGLEPLVANATENGLGGKMVNGNWYGIYPDLAILEGTRRLIAEYPEWRLPSMNRLLVESAMHRDRVEALLSTLPPAWREYQNRFDGIKMAEGGQAKNVLLDVSLPFEETSFPSDGGERVRTRLGEEGARIEFAESVVGPFGAMVSGVALPAHWSHGVRSTEPVRVEYEDDRLRIPIGDRVFYYDRRGITKGVQ